MHQAIRAVSSIIHVCIDGTGLFIGLLNRMSWMVGNGPADLYKKLSQNTLPCLLTMGGYHLVVDWDKQRNRYLSYWNTKCVQAARHIITHSRFSSFLVVGIVTLFFFKLHFEITKREEIVYISFSFCTL